MLDKRLIIAYILALPGLCCPVFAEQTPPHQIIEVRLVPEIGVPGQMRRLEISILTDHWFLSAPEYPAIKIDGAIVLAPGSFGTNFTERRYNQVYAGQRQNYLVFPQRHGAFLVKQFEVSLSVPGDDGFSPVNAIVGSQQISFVTREVSPSPVPLRNGFDGILASSKVTFADEYTFTEGEGPSVGDVYSRIITLSASDTLAMFIPPFDQNPGTFESVSEDEFTGGRIYRQVTDVSDSRNRGVLSAQREEIWEYIFEEAGEFILPALHLTYWDLQLNQWQRLSLDEKRIRVLDKPFKVSMESKGYPIVRDAGVKALLLLVFIGLSYALYRAYRYWIDRGRVNWQKTEFYQWRKLRWSCGRMDFARCLPFYYAWFAHYSGSSVSVPEPLQEMLRSCYAASPQHDEPDFATRDLLLALGRFRRSLRSDRTVVIKTKAHLLDLNPVK